MEFGANLAREMGRLDVGQTVVVKRGATLAVEPFLDDLTNWHVRRSRRRFWKSEQDDDWSVTLTMFCDGKRMGSFSTESCLFI